MPAIRNRKKLRATTVPIRLTDEQRTALRYMSLETNRDVADIITQAVMKVFGKEIDEIIDEKNLDSDEQGCSELNRKELTA